MKKKRINTIPNGIVIIVILGINLLLSLFLGVLILPSAEAMGLFGVSLVLFLLLMHYVKNQYCNFITITKEGVSHGGNHYNWENVFITVGYRKPNFLRNSFDYYAFLDDHYLTKEEIETQRVKKGGLYLILTTKRTKWLLSFCKKEIKILDESPYHRNEDVVNQIKIHNRNIINMQ